MLDADIADQISRLELDPSRPLVISDVDEVVVHFIAALEAYLADHALWLDPASFALNGNIKRRVDNVAIETAEIGAHLQRFFRERTRHLEAVEGASAALASLSRSASVVMLTNVPFDSLADRVLNLAGHGMPYPVIANRGPKGPAVATIAARHTAPIAFIDDIPGYLSSVGEHRPGTHLVHFANDARFSRHIGPLDYVSLSSGDWRMLHDHIAALLFGPVRTG